MGEELKPYVRLTPDSPEWVAEWEDLERLMEGWKYDPNDEKTRERLNRALYRIGILPDDDE